MQPTQSHHVHLISTASGGNARLKQNLTRIDVANANHNITSQKHLLDGRAPLGHLLNKHLCIKVVRQRLHTQPPQQFGHDGLL